MKKAQSQHSFIRSINISIFVSTLLLAIITLIFYSICGLIDTYNTKIEQVNNLSALLAISSSSASGSVIASAQIAQISYQDQVIKDAIFYPFERIENLANPEDLGLYEILTRDTVSIQEPVASDITAHRSTGLENNRTLMGYINITINLDELRKQWFERHQYELLITILGYILLALLLSRRLDMPLRQLKKLTTMVSKSTKVDIDNINPLLNYDFDYIELTQIQELIYELNHRYTTEHKAYLKLKKLKSQDSHDQALSLRESNFQNMITHELKTSLDSILSGLQLLSNYYMSDEQQRLVNIIQKGSKQLEFTLNQIIQLNRIEKGQMSVQVEEFQPIQLINELVDEYQPVAQSRGIKLYSHINHIDCILYGDEQKIHSIVRSLLSNALKFTEKGSVKVESSLIYFEDSVRWWINVIDTGMGVDEKHLKDIFSPFLHINPTTKTDVDINDGGVGLGLANKLAQLLDGQILVESQLGKGSRFSLVIPLPNNQHANNNNLLRGIKVVCYTLKNLDEIITTLTRFGIKFIKLDDKQRVLDYIGNNYANLLVIASGISYEQAIKLTQQIREREVSTRLLIAYYQDGLTQTQLNNLQAAGVDLCRPVTANNDLRAEAMVFKSWLGL